MLVGQDIPCATGFNQDRNLNNSLDTNEFSDRGLDQNENIARVESNLHSYQKPDTPYLVLQDLPDLPELPKLPPGIEIPSYLDFVSFFAHYSDCSAPIAKGSGEVLFGQEVHAELNSEDRVEPISIFLRVLRRPRVNTIRKTDSNKYSDISLNSERNNITRTRSLVAPRRSNELGNLRQSGSWIPPAVNESKSSIYNKKYSRNNKTHKLSRYEKELNLEPDYVNQSRFDSLNHKYKSKYDQYVENIMKKNSHSNRSHYLNDQIYYSHYKPKTMEYSKGPTSLDLNHRYNSPYNSLEKRYHTLQRPPNYNSSIHSRRENSFEHGQMAFADGSNSSPESKNISKLVISANNTFSLSPEPIYTFSFSNKQNRYQMMKKRKHVYNKFLSIKSLSKENKFNDKSRKSKIRSTNKHKIRVKKHLFKSIKKKSHGILSKPIYVKSNSEMKYPLKNSDIFSPNRSININSSTLRKDIRSDNEIYTISDNSNYKNLSTNKCSIYNIIKNHINRGELVQSINRDKPFFFINRNSNNILNKNTLKIENHFNSDLNKKSIINFDQNPSGKEVILPVFASSPIFDSDFPYHPDSYGNSNLNKEKCNKPMSNLNDNNSADESIQESTEQSKVDYKPRSKRQTQENLYKQSALTSYLYDKHKKYKYDSNALNRIYNKNSSLENYSDNHKFLSKSLDLQSKNHNYIPMKDIESTTYYFDSSDELSLQEYSSKHYYCNKDISSSESGYHQNSLYSNNERYGVSDRNQKDKKFATSSRNIGRGYKNHLHKRKKQKKNYSPIPCGMKSRNHNFADCDIISNRKIFDSISKGIYNKRDMNSDIYNYMPSNYKIPNRFSQYNRSNSYNESNKFDSNKSNFISNKKQNFPIIQSEFDQYQGIFQDEKWKDIICEEFAEYLKQKQVNSITSMSESVNKKNIREQSLNNKKFRYESPSCNSFSNNYHYENCVSDTSGYSSNEDIYNLPIEYHKGYKSFSKPPPNQYDKEYDDVISPSIYRNKTLDKTSPYISNSSFKKKSYRSNNSPNIKMPELRPSLENNIYSPEYEVNSLCPLYEVSSNKNPTGTSSYTYLNKLNSHNKKNKNEKITEESLYLMKKKNVSEDLLESCNKEKNSNIHTRDLLCNVSSTLYDYKGNKYLREDGKTKQKIKQEQKSSLLQKSNVSLMQNNYNDSHIRYNHQKAELSTVTPNLYPLYSEKCEHPANYSKDLENWSNYKKEHLSNYSKDLDTCPSYRNRVEYSSSKKRDRYFNFKKGENYSNYKQDKTYYNIKENLTSYDIKSSNIDNKNDRNVQEQEIIENYLHRQESLKNFTSSDINIEKSSPEKQTSSRLIKKDSDHNERLSSTLSKKKFLDNYGDEIKQTLNHRLNKENQLSNYISTREKSKIYDKSRLDNMNTSDNHHDSKNEKFCENNISLRIKDDIHNHDKEEIVVLNKTHMPNFLNNKEIEYKNFHENNSNTDTPLNSNNLLKTPFSKDNCLPITPVNFELIPTSSPKSTSSENKIIKQFTLPIIVQHRPPPSPKFLGLACPGSYGDSEYVVELCSSVHDAFLHLATVTEDTYMNMRREQSLLLPFPEFPRVLAGLLNAAKSKSDKGLQICLTKVENGLDLRVLERSPYRELTHFQLPLRKAPPTVAAQFASLERSALTALIKVVCNSLLEHRKSLEYTHTCWKKAQRYFQFLETDHENTIMQLKSKFEFQNDKNKRHYQKVLEDIKIILEEKYKKKENMERSIRSNIEGRYEELLNKNSELQNRLSDEQRSKTAVDWTLQRREHEITTLETQVEELTGLLEQVRTSHIQQDSAYFEQAKELVSLQHRLARAEELNDERADLLEKEKEARMIEQETKLQAQADLQKISERSAALGAQLGGAAAEMEKGNGALLKLKEQLKAARSSKKSLESSLTIVQQDLTKLKHTSNKTEMENKKLKSDLDKERQMKTETETLSKKKESELTELKNELERAQHTILVMNRKLTAQEFNLLPFNLSINSQANKGSASVRATSLLQASGLLPNKITYSDTDSSFSDSLSDAETVESNISSCDKSVLESSTTIDDSSISDKSDLMKNSILSKMTKLSDIKTPSTIKSKNSKSYSYTECYPKTILKQPISDYKVRYPKSINSSEDNTVSFLFETESDTIKYDSEKQSPYINDHKVNNSDSNLINTGETNLNSNLLENYSSDNSRKNSLNNIRIKKEIDKISKNVIRIKNENSSSISKKNCDDNLIKIQVKKEKMRSNLKSNDNQISTSNKISQNKIEINKNLENYSKSLVEDEFLHGQEQLSELNQNIKTTLNTISSENDCELNEENFYSDSSSFKNANSHNLNKIENKPVSEKNNIEEKESNLYNDSYSLENISNSLEKNKISEPNYKLNESLVGFDSLDGVNAYNKRNSSSKIGQKLPDWFFDSAKQAFAPDTKPNNALSKKSY